jgi:hypothetical protein
LKKKLAVCEREDEKKKIEKEIEGWTLKLNLLADSQRRGRSRK